MEGVGAVVEHLLGTVMSVNGGLDAEAVEHGVRLPAAEELDGVGIDASAEKSRGTAGPE